MSNTVKMQTVTRIQHVYKKRKSFFGENINLKNETSKEGFGETKINK